MIRRLTLATAVLPLALLPSVAHAATWSGAEPTGDATSTTYSPDPPPCGTFTETVSKAGDITRLTVRHTRTTVQLTLVVAGLADLKDAQASFAVGTHRMDWELDVSKSRGKVEAWLMDVPEYPTDEELAQMEADGQCYFLVGSSGEGCSKVHAAIDVDAGRITASIPRSCLDNPQWVRAGGSVSGTTKGAGGVYVTDEWAPKKLDDGDWRTPTYGPKVAHPKRAEHRA